VNDPTNIHTPPDTGAPAQADPTAGAAPTDPGPVSAEPDTSGLHPARPVPAGRPPARRRAGRRAARSGHPRPSGWLAGHRHRLSERPSPLRRAAVTVTAAGLAVAVSAGPAFADPPKSLNEVISRITAWLVGIAAGLATLFLTYGAVRYLSAGGDPGSVEKAKTALRSAAIGYGLAVIAPLVVTLLQTFVS
jgi:hypothetical protein